MKKDSAARMPTRTKWLIFLGTLLGLYTVIGFFVVPAVIKAQMLERLPALTKRQISVADVKFNPFALSLTIDGFALKETNGDVFSSFAELYVNFQMSSIFRGCYVFDEISLKDPFGQVIYFKDGTFNFGNLINNPAPTNASVPAAAQKSQSLPQILVHHLYITNGAVAFSDLARKNTYQTRYQPINVDLKDFTTVRDQSSLYEIAATGDAGERIGWAGKITVNPLRSTGKFALTGFNLNRYKPYSQDYARYEIVDGQMEAGAEYRYDSATNALGLEVTNAFLTLRGFNLKTPDTSENVLTIPSLAIEHVSANLAQRTAEVGLVKSSNGSVLARQNKDGSINLLSYVILPPRNPETNAAAPTTPAGPPWTAKIDEIAFDNYAIKAEDKVPSKGATFNIDQLGFNLKNVSTASDTPVTFALSARLQETGHLGLSGFATLSPAMADVVIGLTNLDLRAAQSYLEEYVKIAVTHGGLNVNGHAHYAASGAKVPLVSFAGEVSVKDFAVTDEVQFDDLAKWDSLDITGIDLALQPNKFHVDRIKFTGPSSTVRIGPDRRVNFLAMLPERKPAPAKTNAAPPPLPEITVGEFAFEKGSLHFIDRSIEPNCTFDLQDSGGTVKNISSLVQTPATVDVRGKVDQFSTFAISGRLNPMPDKLFTDITVAFTNTGLTDLSPYTEKYAGRPLQKGKMSLALHYRIEQKALGASNVIFIDQLTLGAKNGSTNATKLPVKLAIALLKDRHGRIKLDVPLHGRIDDPQFRLAPIIWGVVENLIVKAATSPFSLLGSMFGGGDELSFVVFDPGQAEVPLVESKKLDTLGKALFERPTLSLEINGAVDPVTDRDPMVRTKFDRQIKALYLKELTDAGKPPVDMVSLKLTAEDYARLVPVAYSNSFGAYHSATNQTTNATDSILPIAPIAVVVIPAAKPPPPRPRSNFEHGAAHMMFLGHRNDVLPPAVAPIVAITNKPQTAIVTTSPAPPPVAAGDLAVMEEKLLRKVEITSDDYRQLMQDRAKAVEAYLLKSGKITAERLFITVPKTIKPDAKGEDRVNLTLD